MSDTRVVYKGGAWDPLHVGHLNVLQFAANLGDILVVGVSTDDTIRKIKHREPLYPFCDRIRIMSELRCVDIVVPAFGADNLTYTDLFHVDIFVGSGFYGQGEGEYAERQKRGIELLKQRGVRLVRFPETPSISSAQARREINV